MPNWAASAPTKPNVYPKLLQQLRDMGFPRERCVEAIQAIDGRLDAATNFLLNNSLPPLQKSLGGQFGLAGRKTIRGPSPSGSGRM